MHLTKVPSRGGLWTEDVSSASLSLGFLGFSRRWIGVISFWTASLLCLSWRNPTHPSPALFASCLISESGDETSDPPIDLHGFGHEQPVMTKLGYYPSLSFACFSSLLPYSLLL
jgi:hypothetical protein